MFNTIFLTFRPPKPFRCLQAPLIRQFHFHAIFPFESSTSFIVPNQPCKKHPVLCPNCHTLAPTPSKSQNICRPFGCRLVGHCIAYEWAIHTTNTELLSAEHFQTPSNPSRNATKPPSKRHQTTLETPPNHPRNAIKPLSKRRQNPPPNPTHIFP